MGVFLQSSTEAATTIHSRFSNTPVTELYGARRLCVCAYIAKGTSLEKGDKETRKREGVPLILLNLVNHLGIFGFWIVFVGIVCPVTVSSCCDKIGFLAARLLQ